MVTDGEVLTSLQTDKDQTTGSLECLSRKMVPTSGSMYCRTSLLWDHRNREVSITAEMKAAKYSLGLEVASFRVGWKV